MSDPNSLKKRMKDLQARKQNNNSALDEKSSKTGKSQKKSSKAVVCECRSRVGKLEKQVKEHSELIEGLLKLLEHSESKDLAPLATSELKPQEVLKKKTSGATVRTARRKAKKAFREAATAKDFILGYSSLKRQFARIEDNLDMEKLINDDDNYLEGGLLFTMDREKLTRGHIVDREEFDSKIEKTRPEDVLQHLHDHGLLDLGIKEFYESFQ